MQAEQVNTILDYGELAIGLGTFILGITVAIATDIIHGRIEEFILRISAWNG